MKELEGVKFKEVTTRFGQAFAVNEAGEVYAWGMKTGDPWQSRLVCSMGFGVVGTQPRPVPLPTFGPGGRQILHVACGISHTLFTGNPQFEKPLAGALQNVLRAAGAESEEEAAAVSGIELLRPGHGAGRGAEARPT